MNLINLGLVAALLVFTTPSWATLNFLGTTSCEHALAAKTEVKIEGFLKGSGAGYVVSAKDFLAETFSHSDPRIMFANQVLKHADIDPHVDPILRSSLAHLKSQMNTAEIIFVFLDSGLELRASASALSGYSAIQKQLVIVPHGVPTNIAYVHESESPDPRFFVIFDLARVTKSPGQGVAVLLHELTHITDIHRLGEAASNISAWPRFIQVTRRGGRAYVSQGSISLILESRAYTGEFRTLKNMGLLTREYLESVLRQLAKDPNLIDPGGGDPLVAAGIYDGRNFSTSRFFQLADALDKWLP